MHDIARRSKPGELLKNLTAAKMAKEDAARPTARLAAAKPTPKSTANKYAGTSDSMIAKYFCHKLTNQADRAELKAELTARRITVEPGGSYTRSFGRNK